jgi:hypothetical protein
VIFERHAVFPAKREANSRAFVQHAVRERVFAK